MALKPWILAWRTLMVPAALNALVALKYTHACRTSVNPPNGNCEAAAKKVGAAVVLYHLVNLPVAPQIIFPEV